MKNLTYSGFLRSDEKFYSTGEEWANAITHALATVAAIVGLVFLTIYATDSNSPLVVTTVTIFGSSLILLYLASTLYHANTISKSKRIFQLFDHSAIFLLIAGAIPPFTLNVLEQLDWLYRLCGCLDHRYFRHCLFNPWLIKMSDKWNTCLICSKAGASFLRPSQCLMQCRLPA